VDLHVPSRARLYDSALGADVCRAAATAMIESDPPPPEPPSPASSPVDATPSSPSERPPRDPRRSGAIVLPLEILPQPTDATCGPTCLHAVYRYWGDEVTLDEVINSTRDLGDGRGTFAVMLGLDALRRGYDATLFTFNLGVFDPTWFDDDGDARPELLQEKLRLQEDAKCSSADDRFHAATRSYLDFLELGGAIRFRNLTASLIADCVRYRHPVLTGLSSTYLYRCAREWGPNDDYDDVRGVPQGHFVVIHGYDPASRSVRIADPLADNPGFASQSYPISMARLVPAIMLGVLTHDANLLVVSPRSRTQRPEAVA
jgi:hypothetical protein